MRNEAKVGLIYMYTSPSGKKYIGQTINEKSRKWDHKNRTSKKDTKFGAAIRKYGFENLDYTIIIKFQPTFDKIKLKRVLNKLEERYILLYDSRNNGYNLTTGGDSFIHSEESITKMKNIALNMSEDHRKKLSEAAKERGKLNMDDPEKSQSIINNLSKGWHSSTNKSEETKKKMSNSKKNKKCVLRIGENEEVLEFDSIESAAKSIESVAKQKTKANRISECCNGKEKSAYGYVWMFKD